MKLNYKKFDTEKLTIVPLADAHYGSKYHKKEEFLFNLEWILNSKDTYVIDMGDLMETATRDSVGAGIYEQDEMVQKQLEDVYKVYEPLAKEGKLLGMHRGNHEMRVFNHSGLDLTKTLCTMLKVPYFKDGVLHYFKVGKNNYTIYSTHGSSGSQLPHTKIKACIDTASMVDVEIYLYAHTHQLSHHTRMYYQVDKRKRSVIEEAKHFILCGSYLEHWGSYAMQKGYEMMRVGSPKVKLHGNGKKRIRVSL